MIPRIPIHIPILGCLMVMAGCQTTEQSSATQRPPHQAVATATKAPQKEAKADCALGATPLPDDVSVEVPSADVPAAARAFSGRWANGSWNGQLCGALIVERIEPDGTAHVIYSWGKGRYFGPGYSRETGSINDGVLKFYPRSSVEVSYKAISTDQIRGWYNREGVWTIELSRL